MKLRKMLAVISASAVVALAATINVSAAADSCSCGSGTLSYASTGSGTHSITCSNSECTIDNSSGGTCSGGTANCVDKAVCEKCGAAYGSVNSSNHKTAENRAAIPATCTGAGKQAGTFCTDCDTYITGGDAIGELGHDFPNKDTVACNADVVCAREGCNETDGKGEQHTWKTASEVPCNEDIPCTNTGCTVKNTGNKGTKHVPADEWQKDATDHWKNCENCDTEAAGSAKANHVWDGGVLNDEKTQITKTCTVCGKTDSSAYSATTHDCSSNGSEVAEVPSTCLQKGTKAHYVCTTANCGLWYADSACTELITDASLPLAEHTWGAWTAAGNGKETRECDVCGAEEERDVEELVEEEDTPSDTPAPAAPASSPNRGENSDSGSFANMPAAGNASADKKPASSAASKLVTAAKAAKNIKNSKEPEISYNAEKAGVTKNILTAFANNKNAETLTAETKDFSITISKDDISDKKALAGLNLKTNSKPVLSDRYITRSRNLKNSKDVIQLNFNSKDTLRGIDKVTLGVSTDKKYSGKKVVIYEVANGKLTKVGTAEVAKDGSISFDVDHLGKFIVSVK